MTMKRCNGRTRWGFCGAVIEQREDGRWWEPGTGHPHSCHNYQQARAGQPAR